MSSLFIAHERDRLFRRLENLGPDRSAVGSNLTGHDTLLHLDHDLAMVLGDAPDTRTGNAWTRSAGRWLVLNFVPWPEKLPADRKDLFGTAPGESFDADFARYVENLKRFDARSNAGSLPPHARYGALTRSDWGKYMYLHIDWHLNTLQL